MEPGPMVCDLILSESITPGSGGRVRNVCGKIKNVNPNGANDAGDELDYVLVIR